MEKEEILAKLKEYKKEPVYLYGYHRSYGNDVDLKSESFEGFISSPWVIGGASGGNCWGDSPTRGVTAEDPNEITDLDSFLEEVMPEVTFLQYKKIMALVEYQEFSVSEYYGNYNEYKVAYITFDKLAQALSDITYDKSKQLKM